MILVTFITTALVSLVALVVWRQPIYVVIPCFLIFATFDGLYLSSVLLKVPDGAWFTLVLAAFLSSVFVLWRFGKENQWRAEASDKVALWKLLTEAQHDDADMSDKRDLRFTDRFGGASISRLRGIGIFFDKTGSSSVTPTVFMHFLQKFQAAPTVTVFFHVRPLSCPFVPPEDRFSVSRCRKADVDPKSDDATFSNIYYVIIRHGYADSDIISSDLGLLIYENLRSFIIREGSLKELTREARAAMNQGFTTIKETVSTDDSDIEPSKPTIAKYRRALIRQRLAVLQSIYEEQVVYVVGKEQMRIDETWRSGNWRRKIALAAFLWLRNNTGRRIENMDLATEQSIEVGFVKII